MDFLFGEVQELCLAFLLKRTPLQVLSCEFYGMFHSNYSVCRN